MLGRGNDTVVEGRGPEAWAAYWDCADVERIIQEARWGGERVLRHPNPKGREERVGRDWGETYEVLTEEELGENT